VEYVRIAPRTFTAFARRIFSLSADDIVRLYQMPYPEAETVGLALQIYAQIVRTFNVREIWVPKIHLRTGLELEMATRSLWTSDFICQLEGSARRFGEKYHVEPRHAEQVAKLCDRLFDALSPEHGLDRHYGFLLRIAALLHEAGLFVNSRNHHKHSMYLIHNSDLFGLTQEDILLVALIARYHRRAMPLSTHPFYGALSRERKLVVQALAALLRVADALDRGHTQRISVQSVEMGEGRCVIRVAGADDLTVERAALKEKADLFEAIYGGVVTLEQEGATRGAESNV
jgi:exopolyphosphatase/guanosine-5'-triphosphate,3'-diphosphate pyrophosphatase